MFGEEVTLTDLLLIKQGTVEGFFKDSGHSNSHLPHAAFQEESPGREKVKLQRELESTCTHSCCDEVCLVFIILIVQIHFVLYL